MGGSAVLAIRLAARLCLALGIAFVGAPSQVLDKCKASMDKKNGWILVDASSIDGTLLWGYDPFDVSESFAHEAKCLSKGKANKCTLAPAGNPLRTMPPSFCRLYLADDSDTCEAWVQGCVPGARPICPLDVQSMGGWCIDDKANAFTSGEEQGVARLICL
jgi:hypothetical protein